MDKNQVIEKNFNKDLGVMSKLIIFAEKYIQWSEYIFNKNILQITLKNV